MRRRTGIVALIGFVVAAPLGAQAPVDSVSADRLMTTVRTLAAPELQGRAVGTPGGAKAREWILAQFRAIGLQPIDGGYEKPVTVTPKKASAGAETGAATVGGVNVMGVCRSASAAAGYVVLSAHYDHVGVRDGKVYPGADDNASGVAVLLEAARACVARPFRHHLLVVAFDAEEAGLQGATAFVNALPVPRDQARLNVNLDMVARGDKGELYASGLTHTPSLQPILAPVAARAPIRLRFGHDQPGTGHDDWTLQSDHGVFHRSGIPYVYFGVEDHPDYHQPTDTPDKIDPKFFAAAAATILDALRALDAGI